ncbi:MAG: SH3 domain-containing protein [Desulfurivibrionaceae bacterium]
MKFKLTTVLVSFLAVLFLFSTQAQAFKMVSVAVDLLNMRSGPGTKYEVTWQLGKGYPLMIQETRGEWYKVKDYENDSGWVHKKYVNRDPHLIVKKDLINIRSARGTKNRVVRQAKKGVVFKTLKKSRGWVKVKHEKENVTGWVKRNLLWGW